MINEYFQNLDNIYCNDIDGFIFETQISLLRTPFYSRGCYKYLWYILYLKSKKILYIVNFFLTNHMKFAFSIFGKREIKAII